MAMASANATESTKDVCTLLAASGLRPMASMALPAIMPMARAGTMDPSAMVKATNKFLSEKMESPAVTASVSIGKVGKTDEMLKSARIVEISPLSSKGLKRHLRERN